MKRFYSYLIISFAFLFICTMFGCSNKPKEEEPEEPYIKDEIAPFINITYGYDITIEVGEEFSLMSDIKGLDNLEGNITERIQISDDGFSNNKPGIYHIKYDLTDSDGNKAETKERIIRVIDSKNVKLIAHRGGKGYGVENTIEAFSAASSRGYYGLECDVQPTKDGEIVVYHDLNINNLTGIDAKVIDCDYSYLQSLTLTKTENGVTRTGKILSFKEYLDFVNSNNCFCFIEIKESNTKESLDKVMTIISESGLSSERYILICNSAKINLLYDLKKQYPKVKMMFVGRTDYDLYLEDCYNNNIGIDLSDQSISSNGEKITDILFESLVEKFKKKGLPTGVWVINDKKVISKYLGLSIDYITTDTIEPIK